jgi:hypothetical protein
MMRHGLQKFAMFDEYLEAPDWKEMINDKKKGVVIMTKVSASGLNGLKASGILEFPIEEVFNMIGNPANRKLYDSNFESYFYLMKAGV